MTKQEGIRDPWRPGSRSEDPPDQKENVIGTPASDHPLDWDLEPEKRFLFRMDGVPNWLMVKGADDPPSAARVIMRAIRKCKPLKAQLERYEFVFGGVKEAHGPGWMITDTADMLRYPDAKDGADGFRRFLQVLLYASNTEQGFREAINEVGLFPVLE